MYGFLDPPVRSPRTVRRVPGRLLRLLAALLGILFTGCGDDPAAPADTELEGTWQATSAQVVTTGAPTVQVDLVDAGGSFTLTLNAGGSFTIVQALPGEGPETITGSWTASVDVLRLDFTSGLMGRWEFDMTLSAQTLSLRGADTEYDVDGDGDDEAVKLNLTLARA